MYTYDGIQLLYQYFDIQYIQYLDNMITIILLLRRH